MGRADQSQYPPSSPSPQNFHRPGATPAPAPFYVVGTEVPAHGGPPPLQQQYPPRHQGQRVSSAGKQPAPIQTSSPPPGHQYAAYSHPGPPAGQGPQSTYGNPQELSTSVYDSPVAAHNPNSAATYSSSVYSPDEAYTSPTIGGPSAPSAPSVAAPSAPAPPAPSQQPYQSFSYQQQQHSQAPQPYGHGYDGGSDVPPPRPTGQAPPVPQGQGRPSDVMSPPPLHPSGPAYDSRHSQPDQMAVPGGAAPQGQPQYKAYVPQADAPSAPNDYYRQPGVY